ncbi:ABC transporter substrate-binding protein [Agromyces aerolatus]|uniref:ABC transporter substrate-binding protein n=1 Tax=Agromyces sp. LY-1074 TaxID=3074080 RepID=UPI0028562C7C|nr:MULTISPECIES: ABC transporter substrate-binding protein [unclassified Agromyces]MDR5700848.1 ABC transporter substrate-binding protein [Agromyces sp. LY-1074]MDR5707491.1 ABC transporter substrate-binding protein [Agromyces sp. LY-1358]
MHQRSASKAAAIAAIAVVSVGLTSCVQPSSPEPDAPTTLTIGWSAQVLTLDPPNESASAGIAVLHNVYETLVSYDFETAELTGELATDWTVSEDGLTYTFELAEDATFATGDPVTSADVLYSFQRVIDWEEAVQGAQIRPALSTATMSAPDEHTVEIVLATPSASFLPSLSGTTASIISEAQVTAAAGDDVEAQRAWLNENTAGSGLYQVTEWVPNSYVMLGANEHPWADEPMYRTVEIEVIAESSQQLAALQQGDINVALDLLPQQVQTLGDGFEVLEGVDLSTYYVGMNFAIAPFDQPQVREAVKYAINYDDIVGGLLNGKAEKVGGVVPEGLAGHDASLASDYEFDPDRARELLAEAGYPDGFTFDLYYVSGDTVRGLGVPLSTVAEKIQADLAEVGISVNVVAQDLSTLFTAYREGNLPALLWYFGSTIPDADQIVSAHGDWNTQATTRLGYQDDELTAMILEARTLADGDARGALYEEIGQRLSADGPYAFMFRPVATVVTTEGVEGFSWTPIWVFDLS